MVAAAWKHDGIDSPLSFLGMDDGGLETATGLETKHLTKKRQRVSVCRRDGRKESKVCF
jgi:hypothetical protein